LLHNGAIFSGFLIRRIFQLLLPRLESVLDGRNLTLSQWIALKLIFDGTSNTSAKLCDEMGHDPGAMTRALNHLERIGLLKRLRRSDDRRIVNLELTAAGVDLVTDIKPAMHLFWDNLLGNFDNCEISTLVRLMGGLVSRMENVE
jgi:DNA-binding MarR family transcriptional regulator